jgi:hypothetical protein
MGTTFIFLNLVNPINIIDLTPRQIFFHLYFEILLSDLMNQNSSGSHGPCHVINLSFSLSHFLMFLPYFPVSVFFYDFLSLPHMLSLFPYSFIHLYLCLSLSLISSHFTTTTKTDPWF